MLSEMYLRRLYELRSGIASDGRPSEEEALLNAARAGADMITGEFERNAFLLRYDKGLKWSQIADILNSSTADNVLKRCRKALHRLRSKRYTSAA